ncbi:Crp/Fnr family transcriptional regulator [Ichthyenterobacterium magnum]|uniref:CRP-like cAMP-binding protein n=1 Tax=Ichthyenterobacterium magnum TaxID=1230530 RepID=A0A420DV07_9FLAO|nr:Crp/Fnr family transcriptional regulator [Ichthyenterobacterium magnum]RKE98131.1 CRP-like cAMP-binding protein [Ichthyenterobacterium magnum]
MTQNNIYSSLINAIKELVTLNVEDVTMIEDVFELKKHAKKEIVLFKGETSNHMRFVVEGCLRSYYINEEGQEYIVQFGIKNWWINDLYSYLTKTPAQYFVQALKPTTVLQIHRDKLEQLFVNVPAMERFFRIKIEKAYVANQNRTLQSMSESAESRYKNFIKNYRSIEQEVPQYMVASYLGITPEHLSTIRKNLHK